MPAKAPVLIAAALAAVTAQTAPAETFSGPVTVVDSDVLSFDGQRVMLFGLESVERNQSCRIDGTPWACYAAAVRQLETMVSLGEVVCTAVGEADRYGRYLGRCMVGGEDLNEAFVQSGFAVARPDETEDFVAAEKAAEEEGAGLWQGEFQRPDDYRFSVGIFVDRP
jgi:endonuclease YncB( thermonuclease family)